jgi:hypothetical protein
LDCIWKNIIWIKKAIARLAAAGNLDTITLFIQQHWTYHCRDILTLVSSMLIVEFVLCFVEKMHSNSRGLKLRILVPAIHTRVQELSNDLWVKEVLKRVEYCLSYTIAKRPALQSDPMFPEHVQYFSKRPALQNDPMFQNLYSTFLGA